ncbi:MAG: hypothetical protein F4Z72_03710 [Gemmatimonadales bacterium]|nr:hypothetical protein [Candidatus Palauibacter irciniicola]MYC19082.1 hypothetical protein [Gemmatimonadales bacterium]
MPKQEPESALRQTDARQSDVRECAMAACQRVGLYRRISDPDSDLFLDRRCVELVEASADRCPVSPPYNDTLMTFKARYVGALKEKGYETVRVYLQRLCTEEWTWRRWCRYHARRVSGLLLAVALGAAGPRPADGQDVFYSEPAPGVGATTELAGGAGFREDLIVDLYFYARASGASDLVADVILPGDRSTEERVFAVSRAAGTEGAGAGDARVERCRVVDRGTVCEPLDPPASIGIGGCGDAAADCWGDRVEIELPSMDMDWGGEFLRLTLPRGAFTLTGCACEDIGGPLIAKRDAAGNAVTRDSPELVVPLPAPSDVERQYLEQRPFLRFNVHPLVRDESGVGGFEDLSLSFDGGVYRQQAHGRWLAQARWSGDLATRAETNFNRVTLEAGGAFNLLPGDWLPLALSAKGQSDQGFDAVDMSAEARLAYVLPFNPTLQSGAYRPATAPRLHVLAAYGRGLARPAQATDSGTGTPEASFRRVGYELWWRLPVSGNALLNIHHAGLWNRPEGAGGDFHTLWDLALEVDLGGVTYLVGYQRGSAAPLFVPIETTRAGLSFAIGGGTAEAGR